ncbi:MAG: hypothetical protein ACLU40_02830 [Acutalibacteraceae bacterium]
MSRFSKGVERLLQRSGSDAIVYYPNELNVSVKAIIQPMRYKNKMYLDMDRNELGFRDNECFLYIGPPWPDFCHLWNGVVIKSGGRSFGISRADKISFGGETVYIWAVLKPRIKDDLYDTN